MKNNFLKIAIISFIAVCVLMVGFVGFGVFVDFGIFYNNWLIVLGFYVGSVFMIYIPLIIALYFCIASFKVGKKVVELEAGNFDINKDKKYYREILEDYSALQLAYINKLDTLKEEDIISELLELQLKGVIELQDNEVVIADYKNITEEEKYLLKKIQSGKVIADDLNALTRIVVEEASKNELVKEDNNKIKDIISMIVKTICLNFISIIIFVMIALINYELDYDISSFISLIIGFIVIILLILIIFSWTYLISYIVHKNKSHDVTEKGKEIKTKLYGLHGYIKDFSNLDKKEKEALTLWDEYLVYSVMFKENDVIINDMKDLLNVTYRPPLTTKHIFIIAFLLALLFLIMI